MDVARLRFADPALARQARDQWTWRGVPDLQLRMEGRSAVLSRTQGSFADLHDTDAGFDPLLVRAIRALGLTPVFRLYNDPWLAPAQSPAWLGALPETAPGAGVLFSAEDPPGGQAARPFWRAWLERQGAVQFLPEFSPVASARLMARALPANTYRAHSISASELRELSPGRQAARWRRAIEERSCRLLLVRMAPNDTMESFQAQIAMVSNAIKRCRLQASFPRPRAAWTAKTPGPMVWSPWIALAIVCLAPPLALGWARNAFPRWRSVFFRTAAASLLGAFLAAAVADHPYTRLSIVPFRGVKAAFLISWGLSLLVLYERAELRALLKKSLTRRDLLIGLSAAAAAGYVMLRTGNAAAGWKPPWEQPARDLLEAVLVARPRFKEFVLGWPALWAGCCVQSLYLQRRSPWDGRLLMWLGMMGPISMINTFCHLHSPLRIELWRSFNGLAIGALIGAFAVWLLRRFVLSRPRVSFPFADSAEALAYPKGSS